MRVAYLSRPHCTDPEEFICDGKLGFSACVQLAQDMNHINGADRDHFYAVVDDGYYLKHQPCELTVLDHELGQHLDWLADVN